MLIKKTRRAYHQPLRMNMAIGTPLHRTQTHPLAVLRPHLRDLSDDDEHDKNPEEDEKDELNHQSRAPYKTFEIMGYILPIELVDEKFHSTPAPNPIS